MYDSKAGSVDLFPGNVAPQKASANFATRNRLASQSLEIGLQIEKSDRVALVISAQ